LAFQALKEVLEGKAGILDGLLEGDVGHFCQPPTFGRMFGLGYKPFLQLCAADGLPVGLIFLLS
jgi:hypothetical protein